MVEYLLAPVCGAAVCDASLALSASEMNQPGKRRKHIMGLTSFACLVYLGCMVGHNFLLRQRLQRQGIVSLLQQPGFRGLGAMALYLIMQHVVANLVRASVGLPLGICVVFMADDGISVSLAVDEYSGSMAHVQGLPKWIGPCCSLLGIVLNVAGYWIWNREMREGNEAALANADRYSARSSSP